MKLLSYLLRYSKGRIALAACVGIVGGVSSAALMIVINERLKASGPSVAAYAWSFAAFVVAVLISNLTSRLLLVHLSQRATYDLNMRLCRQVLATPLRRLEEVGMHRVLTTLTQDVPSITTALIELPFFLINATIIVVCLVYLGWLSLTVLGGLVISLGIGIVTFSLLRRRARAALKFAREEADALLGHFRALTEGTKELKLNRRRREEFFARVLEPTADSYRRHYVKGRTVYAAVHSWGQVLYFIVIGLMLFALPLAQEVGLATLTAYTVTVLYMRAPIGTLMELGPIFSMANIAVEKVEELGLSLAAVGPGEANNDAGAPAAATWERIDLVDVTHTYFQEREERNFICGPVSLTFRPGELVFVMGGNGSGKTTLAKLITGLYVPESGEIRLDGGPVDDHNRDRYRQLFSVIFSDFYLFRHLLGIEPDGLEGRARAGLSRLQLDHKVEVAAGSLSTTELSQGQRKRLALLIAFLEDRPIYLFDEWAADQDPGFREVFYMELLPELKASGKTVIVISHDDRYFHIADRLIKMDYGKIEYDRSAGDAHENEPEMPVMIK
ncbi:MAG: cyclic peptide export ABC transporter [Acidobacteria bacterium]|nr:cyclic peptide export ABC transporter [Acidobacteriota bacterium]